MALKRGGRAPWGKGRWWGGWGRPPEVGAAFKPSSGIEVMHRSHQLTILNVTLPPRMRGHPHDHNMWAIVGLYEGQEDNSFFRRSDRGLAPVNARSVMPGEVILLG